MEERPQMQSTVGREVTAAHQSLGACSEVYWRCFLSSSSCL